MAYNRVNWQNGASGGTPINAANLNTMDKGIKDIDDTLTTSNGKSFEFESENGKYGYKVDGEFHPFKQVDGAKSQSITVNGTYTLEPSTGYDGIESATVEVNVSGGGGAEAIWTNANPNSAFNNQTITLSKSYQKILIKFKESTTSALMNSMVLDDNSASAIGFYVAFAQATTRRRVKWTQGSTSLTFSDASSLSQCIPLAVYGLDMEI